MLPCLLYLLLLFAKLREMHQYKCWYNSTIIVIIPALNVTYKCLIIYIRLLVSPCVEFFIQISAHLHLTAHSSDPLMQLAPWITLLSNIQFGQSFNRVPLCNFMPDWHALKSSLCSFDDGGCTESSPLAKSQLPLSFTVGCYGSKVSPYAC